MKIFTTLILTTTIFLFLSCSEGQTFVQTVNNAQPTLITNSSPTEDHIASNLIEPGKRIGPVYLGADFDSVVSILGVPFFDHTYQYPTCSARNVRWLVDLPDNGKSMLQANYSSEGKIVQVRSEIEGFRTADGTSNWDSLEEFMSKHDSSKLEAYADRGIKRNPKYVDGYSAYIVDPDGGIAFEFAKSREDKTWYINSISVFYPKTAFSKLRYCADNEKTKWWIKLNTFDLDHAMELK